MRVRNFIIPLFVTLFFLSCNEKPKELEVKDVTLEKTVIDTPPPPPPPPYNIKELKKRFKDYTKFKKSEPNVYAPVTKPSSPNIKDPAFLIIQILDKKYTITFLEQTVSANNVNDLETFLQTNNDKINKDKVLVAGFKNSPEQKTFVKLLSRYGIRKFIVNPPQ